jgi:hypothetical protein
VYPEGKRVEEEEEEEEVKAKTLEDFLKEKKSATHFKKEARKAEEVKKTNIEKAKEKDAKVTTLQN